MMNRAVLGFLKNQLQKGGRNAYCALLILGAIERNEKELLKKFNKEVVESILDEYQQTA